MTEAVVREEPSSSISFDAGEARVLETGKSSLDSARNYGTYIGRAAAERNDNMRVISGCPNELIKRSGPQVDSATLVQCVDH